MTKCPSCACWKEDWQEQHDRVEELEAVLSKHDKAWRTLADTIGAGAGWGGIDGNQKDGFGTVERVLATFRALKEQRDELLEAAKAVCRGFPVGRESWLASEIAIDAAMTKCKGEPK